MEQKFAVPVKIDFFADLACPWCHLGMARLQYVRQLVLKDKGIKTKLEYHPTMIDPSTADAGEDYESYN